MDKGIEALREAVRRAPLTKPEGLSPAWQAYFDAVTPLHVAELIATLEQAQQECQSIEQKLIKAAVYTETLESEPRKTNLKQLNEIAGLKLKCEELQEQKDKWSAWAISLGAKADELGSRPLCVKSNDAMREAAPLCVKLPDEISLETATIIAWGLGCAGDIGKIFKAGYDRCRDEISKQQNQQNEPNK